MSEKILITGVSGFIGSHVAEYFLSQGLDPYFLVRDKSKASQLKESQIIIGDITDLNSLTNAFKGADFIIHLAGLAKDWGKYNDFYNTNVTGTLNVLKAAVANNIRDVIITGTISSYGEEDSLTVKNEESPYNSHYPYFLDSIFPCAMNFYRDTKALMTREAIAYARVNNLNLTVIEPAFVYGEREFNTGFYEYMKTVKSGIPFLFGSKTNKISVIYAGDLARIYFMAYQKKLQGIKRILACNKERHNMDYFYSLFCKALNVKKPANLPKFAIYPIGFTLELFYTLFHISTPPMLTRGRVNMFFDNVEFEVTKAEKLLGFKTEISVEEGIPRTVRWYKENHYL